MVVVGGGIMKIETTMSATPSSPPPTAPLMLHDCAYTRKIKAYQNITPIFALCMREIVYDMLFDINCTFGRREMKDAGRKL